MFVLGPLVLVAVVLVVVMVGQRWTRQDSRGEGAEVVPYLVLALAMGVAGFALADLAATAFPGETFVFNPAEEVATSLSALVVSVPFLIYFWRRQLTRRATFPGSAGWTIYLSLIELTFMTAFVISSVIFLTELLEGDVTSTWTGVVVYGAIVLFHEQAVRITPPVSDVGELRRVIGAVIGLITMTIGLIGVLAMVMGLGLESIGGQAREVGFDPWVAMLVVGAPIWWYRWLRPWDSEPAAPRLAWTVVVAIASLAVLIGAVTSVAVLVFQYSLADTPSAGQHFETLPVALAFVFSALGVWLAHRRALEAMPTGVYLVYAYAMAAIGLVAGVSMAIALTVSTFDQTLLVGRTGPDVVTFGTTLVVGAATWLLFERKAVGREQVTGSISLPRRIYTLGFGVVYGLVAAGALIVTLFVVLERLLGSGESGSLLTPLAFLVYTGLPSLYLLRSYFADRTSAPSPDVIAPFAVTIICAHPGMIAARLPDQARVRVLHHDDPAGAITEEMADEIVAVVGVRPSFVWVDGDGFRVTPMRLPN